MVGLVYVGVLEDSDKTTNVIAVQSSLDKLLEYCKVYFGITEDNRYTKPASYLGLVKIDYSEYEDDYYGYFNFKDQDDPYIYRIYIYYKQVDEICN